MVAPAALVAAGWMITESDDPAATSGTVGGTDGRFSGHGMWWGGPRQPERVYYPKELGPELFIGEGRRRRGTFIRFLADCCTRNHEAVISFDGMFSCSSAPLLFYPDGEHPAVPGNRFLDVTLRARGDDLTEGLLECGLTVLGQVAGCAGDPLLVVRAAGLFGSSRRHRQAFSFTLNVSTHGVLRLAEIEIESPEIVVAEARGHVVVRRSSLVRQR